MLSNVSFNADITQRSPLAQFRAKGLTDSFFNAVHHRRAESVCVVSWKHSAFKAYEFAEYQAARKTIKETLQQDDEAGRNALWALNQLEGFTYAPEVVPNSDGTFSFEWKTGRGFGSLKIGPNYSVYHVSPQASGPLEGGTSEPFEPYVGILMNTLLYPSVAPSIRWVEPNASAQMSLCRHLVDCVVASRPSSAATDKLDSCISQAFESAKFVEFEDGKENEFTLDIMRLVKQYGPTAVERISRALKTSSNSNETFAQTLLCFGRMDDPTTQVARGRAVRWGLKSSSAIVRDAATIAIESMFDRDAQAELRSAIKRETVPSLKQDMESALEYLETAP